MSAGIRVDDGEALAALRRLEAAAPGLLVDSTSRLAEVTVELARPTVPRRSGRAASSLPVYQTNGGAEAGGGEGVEYYRWLELGGTAGRGHSVMRPVSSGRYLKPAGERAARSADAVMTDALVAACRSAGFDVS